METIWTIQKAFGDNARCAAKIRVWHKCFKYGRESAESDPRPGRPATSRTPETVERVQAAVNKDRTLAVWELEADLGAPKTTMSEILVQGLDMKHVGAKCALQLLFPEQKEHRVAVESDHSHWTRSPQEGHNQRSMVGLELWSGNEGPGVSCIFFNKYLYFA